MTINLKFSGKKILFIGQLFYDYHTKILDELRFGGAEVTFIQNKFHGDTKVDRLDIIGNLRKRSAPANKKRYADQILLEIQNKQFDYLFCIGGFSITPYLITSVKKLNPEIKTIIYFWDSFKTWNYRNLVGLFDKVFSFDPNDSDNHEEITYLPLFYTKEYAAPPLNNELKDIDILYIGSISILSKNRLGILQQVNDFANTNQLRAFIWLYYPESSRSKLGKIQSFFKKLFVKDFNNYIKLIQSDNNTLIKTSVLKREEIINLMRRAKTVIDIPIPDQLGLTIRTIETLALGDKLITTNPQIAKEDFYNSNRIYLLDENRFDLDLNFITQDNDSQINVSHLELTSWLNTMF